MKASAGVPLAFGAFVLLVADWPISGAGNHWILKNEIKDGEQDARKLY